MKKFKPTSYYSDITIGCFNMQWESMAKSKSGKNLIIKNAVPSLFFSGNRRSFAKLARIYNFNARYWKFRDYALSPPRAHVVSQVSAGFNYMEFNKWLFDGLAYTDTDYVIANNASLSLELYLKEFILQAEWLRISGGKYGYVLEEVKIPASHSLVTLYERIDERHRQIIEELFAGWAKLNQENELSIHGQPINNLLEMLNEIQIKSRYGEDVTDVEKKASLATELSTFFIYELDLQRRANLLA